VTGGWDHAEVPRPAGTGRVSSQLCLSQGVATLPQDGLNEWAARRIRMTGAAG
jgi:hypothetical protein